MSDKNRIVIVLGSNKDSERNIEQACCMLEKLFPVQWAEAVYTRPLHCISSEPFLNRVGLSFTSSDVKELRVCFKQMEKALGRTADSKQSGVIPMDIDLVRWNDIVLKPDDWSRDYVQNGIREIEGRQKESYF